MVYICDTTFKYCLDAYNSHDKSCSSIEEIWMGYSGGFTDLNATFDCCLCGVTFWYEGSNFKDSNLEFDNPYCGCCLDRLTP